MPSIRISVKDFAIPLKKSGHLERESSFGTAELGVKLHQEVQRRLEADPKYAKEVTYAHTVERKGYRIFINGRCDGLFAESPTLLEEIKTTGAPKSLVKSLEESAQFAHPYALQLLTYLYLHWLTKDDDCVGRLRVIGFRDKVETLIEVPFDPEEFREYFEKRVDQIVEAELMRKERRLRRKSLAKEANFPFAAMRPYQQELIDFCEGVLSSETQGIVQAPTGIGKTIGVLLPGIKNALSRGAQTIYVTPKNSQFRLVQKTIDAIGEPLSKPLFAYTLTAKSKLCLNETIVCEAKHCKYAEHFYDKIEEHQLIDRLKKIQQVNGKVLKDIGRETLVCPYYLGHQLLNHADILVCDYNYVFSPRGFLPELLETKHSKDRPVLLVDEAHNLYERALDYYSPKISQKKLDYIEQKPLSISKLDEEWQSIVAELRRIVNYNKKPSSQMIELRSKTFMGLVGWLNEFIMTYLTTEGAKPDQDEVLEFYFAVIEFVSVLDQNDEHSKHAYLVEDGDEHLAIICCNARQYLAEKIEMFHGALVFSATIKPFEFYINLSGLDADARSKEFTTPFPSENRKLLIIPQISTNYRERQSQFRKIAEGIVRIAKRQRGHYFVFFPSYVFLRQLEEVLNGLSEDMTINSQAPNMSEQDIEILCQTLMEPSWSEVSLLLGVQGGRLAEGLDIHSPYLKGVFVVGPAIPLRSFERNLRMDFYQKAFGDGFSYSYIYPAMARSIQAAGRVIRSEDKRGLIVLMDQRFVKDHYVSSMPSFWFKDSVEELVEQGILNSIDAFWQEPDRLQ